jgi:hypothetical protein
MPQPITQAAFELRVSRLRWSLLFVWASVTFVLHFLHAALTVFCLIAL